MRNNIMTKYKQKNAWFKKLKLALVPVERLFSFLDEINKDIFNNLSYQKALTF